MKKIHILSTAFKCLLCLTATMSFASMPTRAQGVFTPQTHSYDPQYEDLRWRKLTERANIYYLCDHAFANEYALSLHDNMLVYIHCKEENEYWYEDTNALRDKLLRHQMLLSPAENRTIRDLMEDATMTANFYEQKAGCDGVLYYLYYWGRKVSVWWPTEGTRTHRTVTAMDSLCRAVETADHSLLTRQLDTLRVLTNEFRHLYAPEYFAPRKWVSKHTLHGIPVIDSYHLKSHSYMLSIKLGVDEGNRETAESYIDSLHDSVTVWARELFLRHHGIQINVLLCDTLEARCHVSSSNDNLLAIPRSALSRSLIMRAATLDNGYYRLSPDGQWQSIRREDLPWWPGIPDMIF